MSTALKGLAITLLIYSFAIISAELYGGQDYVRHYVSDIDGEVLLYGINTTLSTIILSITSYTFVICYLMQNGTKVIERNWHFFFASQAIIFAYLAMDERFMLHERIGYVLGIHDSIPLLFLAVVEFVLLYNFGELTRRRSKEFKSLMAAAICFSIMIIIDAFGPSKGLLRLSLEDLFKIWAVFFLFRYSFCKFILLKTSLANK